MLIAAPSWLAKVPAPKSATNCCALVGLVDIFYLTLGWCVR